MKVKEIYIAKKKGDVPVLKSSAYVEKKKGLVGDRYYSQEGTFSKRQKGDRKGEITFIASEEVDKFNAEQNEKGRRPPPACLFLLFVCSPVNSEK